MVNFNIKETWNCDQLDSFKFEVLDTENLKKLDTRPDVIRHRFGRTQTNGVSNSKTSQTYLFFIKFQSSKFREMKGLKWRDKESLKQLDTESEVVRNIVVGMDNYVLPEHRQNKLIFLASYYQTPFSYRLIYLKIFYVPKETLN